MTIGGIATVAPPVCTTGTAAWYQVNGAAQHIGSIGPFRGNGRMPRSGCARPEVPGSIQDRCLMCALFFATQSSESGPAPNHPHERSHIHRGHGFLVWRRAQHPVLPATAERSEENTSELQSRGHLVCG